MDNSRFHRSHRATAGGFPVAETSGGVYHGLIMSGIDVWLSIESVCVNILQHAVGQQVAAIDAVLSTLTDFCR